MESRSNSEKKVVRLKKSILQNAAGIKNKAGSSADQQPTVYSTSTNIKNSHQLFEDEIVERVCQIMKVILDHADEKCLVIAHVKAFVQFNKSEFAWISSTGKAINTRRSDTWSNQIPAGFSLNLTAIIFGASKDEIAEIINGCINSF